MNHLQIAQNTKQQLRKNRRYLNTKDITDTNPGLELEPFSKDDVTIKLIFEKLSGVSFDDQLIRFKDDMYFSYVGVKEILNEIYLAS